MVDIVQIISLIGVACVFGALFIFFQTIEPFCFYLPGGLGKYYKLHKNISTKYSDLVGCDEIIKDIKLFLDTDYSIRGQGMLFSGPPGNGKTLMARAIAGESKIPFVEICCDNTREIEVIPLIFDHILKTHGKCVIFLDECESILKYSSNTFLRKIDGLESNNNIIFICCTNNASELPEGLTRSGRLEKVINFTNPNINNRKLVLEKLFGSDIDDKFLSLDDLVNMTANFSYADINRLYRDVKAHPECFQSKVQKSIANISFGKNTQDMIHDKHRKRLCYHEIGHAFMAYIVKDYEMPNTITIKKQ
jgi:cell division protease FtsH